MRDGKISRYEGPFSGLLTVLCDYQKPSQWLMLVHYNALAPVQRVELLTLSEVNLGT